MPIDANALLAAIESHLWPFLRISALLVVAPIFSAGSVTVRVRLLLAVLFVALVAPLLPAPIGVDPLSGVGFLIALREIAIGLVMGFLLQMVFSTVVVAGETLAMSMGLGFAMSVDPQNGVQVPVVSQLNVILATLLFLAIDGHLLLLAALADSFQVLPIDGAGLDAVTFGNLVGLGGQIFASALLLALPALTAVLMVNIAFGVITRAAPQLNIFAVGFPVTIMVGFIFMLLSLPAFLGALQRFIERGLQQTLLVLA
jgi:flagellar biosynthetic protein FliR